LYPLLYPRFLPLPTRGRARYPMSYRIGVYEGLEACQAANHVPSLHAPTGIDNVPKLYAVAKSSGVEIRDVSHKDRALADRAARTLGARFDTVRSSGACGPGWRPTTGMLGSKRRIGRS
jgi:hypothetical protein